MQNYILQMFCGQILMKKNYMKPLLIIKKEKEDLEKQVNNYKKKITIFLMLFIVFGAKKAEVNLEPQESAKQDEYEAQGDIFCYRTK